MDILFERIIDILTVFVGVLGLLGNIVALIGFQKQCKKTSTTLLFKALSLADLFVITTVMCYLLSILLIRNIISWRQSAGLFVAMEISVLASTGITVLMAVSRLVAVVFPLQASRLCSVVKMYLYLVATIMFAICYNIPRILYLFEITMIPWSTMADYRPVVYCVIPMGIITSITVILIIKLSYLNKRRAQMTRSQQQRNTTTRLLIAVLFLFIVCSIPLPVFFINLSYKPNVQNLGLWTPYMVLSGYKLERQLSCLHDFEQAISHSRHANLQMALWSCTNPNSRC